MTSIDTTVDPYVFDNAAIFDPIRYHRFYHIPPERTQQEIAFLVDRLQLVSPIRILDLACGHGRHANALAALGHQVTGLDNSPGFLAEAREAAGRMQVAVDYIQADMRSLDDDSVFDVALCLFTAFGYFTDQENAAVVDSVARSLVPGGRFVLDIVNRDRVVSSVRPAVVTECDDDVMIDRTRFDAWSGRCVTARTCIIGGRRQEAAFSVRVYNFQEVSALFAHAGLRIDAAWGDWEGAALGPDKPRLLLVGRKAA